MNPIVATFAVLFLAGSTVFFLKNRKQEDEREAASAGDTTTPELVHPPADETAVSPASPAPMQGEPSLEMAETMSAGAAVEPETTPASIPEPESSPVKPIGAPIPGPELPLAARSPSVEAPEPELAAEPTVDTGVAREGIAAAIEPLDPWETSDPSPAESGQLEFVAGVADATAPAESEPSMEPQPVEPPAAAAEVPAPVREDSIATDATTGGEQTATAEPEGAAVALANGAYLEASPTIADLDPLSRDPDATVRQAAIVAFGQIPDGRVVPYLERALRDPDLDVVRAASEAIARYKFYPAVEPAVGPLPPNAAAIKDAEDEIAAAVPVPPSAPAPAAASLSPAEPEAIDRERQECLAMVAALGDRAEGRAVDARVLQAVDLLGKLSLDLDATVRQEAVGVLGRIPAAEVIPYLERALHDSDRDVVRAASEAIARYKFYPVATDTVVRPLPGNGTPEDDSPV